MGGSGERSWAAIVSASTTSERIVDTTIDGAGGSGYVVGGVGGLTFGQRVPTAVTPETDVLVFFGSRNDAPTGADAVESAARDAFTEAKAIAPDAALVVIGTPWVNDSPPEQVVDMNNRLRAVAVEFGGMFVDPVQDGWFTGDAALLIGEDGVHPTDEGHAYMAELLRPVIESALP